MSEKDIKTKPKSTTKSVQNAPKSVSRSPAETVKDIKAVAKDTIVKNAIDKKFETQQSEQPQRAEVEATEQVESTYYSAADTVNIRLCTDSFPHSLCNGLYGVISAKMPEAVIYFFQTVYVNNNYSHA